MMVFIWHFHIFDKLILVVCLQIETRCLVKKKTLDWAVQALANKRSICPAQMSGEFIDRVNKSDTGSETTTQNFNVKKEATPS